jgi:signal transduction histidine kinase
METIKCSPEIMVPLESVLSTAELNRRPARPPDYQAENLAFVRLAQELANSPTNILEKLVDTALELCRAHSAGISLLEEEAGRKIFRWHAIAGQWAPYVWGTTPRDHSPCGTVLDYNSTLLVSNAHRYYSQFAGVEPLLIEGLLVPFYGGGTAVGTIWVVAHDDTRQFDAEDRRVLESLGKFAAMAYHARSTTTDLAKTNADLQTEIASRKRAEESLRQSEKQLRHETEELAHQLIVSGRLVSLGEVMASMAHEFNNPLGIVLGFVEEMLGSTAPNDPNYHALQIIHEESKRCQQVVSDLLEFARPGRAQFRSTSLADVIEKTLQLVETRLYQQKIRVEKKVDPTLPHIYADPQQIEQVLVNLYLNAIDATPENGRLTIEAKVEQSDGMIPMAVITVADTGSGIAETDMPKIFEPFFTVKKTRGMGLGLSICQRIVKNHGGKIEVKSEPGKGTSFRIHLPLEQHSGEPK